MLQHLCALGYWERRRRRAWRQKAQARPGVQPARRVFFTRAGGAEAEYKAKLKADFDIDFDNLFAITNAPGGRFGERLLKTNNMDRYMNTLIGAFNEETVPAMMSARSFRCRGTAPYTTATSTRRSACRAKNGLTIADMAADPSIPLAREIHFGNHCYACCAGSGSS